MCIRDRQSCSGRSHHAQLKLYAAHCIRHCSQVENEHGRLNTENTSARWADRDWQHTRQHRLCCTAESNALPTVPECPISTTRDVCLPSAKLLSTGFFAKNTAGEAKPSNRCSTIFSRSSLLRNGASAQSSGCSVGLHLIRFLHDTSHAHQPTQSDAKGGRHNDSGMVPFTQRRSKEAQEGLH